MEHGGHSAAEKPGNQAAGAAYVLAAAVAYSSKAIFVKLAYRHGVEPITALALRMVIALPFFAAAALWSRGRGKASVSRADMALIAVLGLAGFYFSAYLDFAGLSYISAGLERLILFLYPSVTVLFAAALYKKPVRRRDIFALLLSYAGVALAFGHGLSEGNRAVYTGGALIFGCTVTYAFYLVGSAEVIRRVGSTRFTAYAMTVSCAAVLGHFALTQPFSALRLPFEVWALGIGMALIATVLPAFLMSEGIGRIGAGKGAIISSVGPVATIFLAWQFLGEGISALHVAGTVLVITGVTMVGGRS